MITVHWGLYPILGVIVAALAYALYYWVVRLRCYARMAQWYIFATVLVVTICSFITMAVVEEKPVVLSDTVAPGETLRQTVAVSAVEMTYPEEQTNGIHATEQVEVVKSSSVFLWLYIAGVGVVLLWFFSQLLWYGNKRRNSTLCSTDEGIHVYQTPLHVPFSFGKSVFLPSSLDGKVSQYALMHEKLHIKHHHFNKLCLMLILVAVNWYNPFVWMFFNEMKLQQELEVDADVLAKGIDRRSYQMSLLQVSLQNSRWFMVQSAFGTKPLKQRIVFMNKKLKPLHTYARMSVCCLILAMLFSTALAIGTQKEYAIRHHPLEGCWTMDFTRPANSTEESYPPFKQYAFYNHDTFFSPHFYKRDGMNFYFGFSGEEVMMRGDSLVNAHGEPMIYKFVSDNTFQCDWKKYATDNSLAQGDIITDQWSKATPPQDVVNAFLLACDAGVNMKHPFDGVWRAEQSADDKKAGNVESYALVNGGQLMMIHYIPDPDGSIYRFSGGGLCAQLKEGKDGLTIKTDFMEATIAMKDDDHATLKAKDVVNPTHFHRIDMPDHIRRMLATTKIGR